MQLIIVVSLVLFLPWDYTDAFLNSGILKHRLEPKILNHGATALSEKDSATSGQASTNLPPTKINKAKPRTGIAQTLLNAALSSPLWKLVLVPQARKNIVQTAQANGIKWTESYDWLSQQLSKDTTIADTTSFPDYYRKEFHAYEQGNLCWDAAMEQELASRAVGARNFPEYGSDGEDAFRGCFENALVSLGATIPEDGTILDLGCGTGTSTRRLAKIFPQANKVMGMDLSPYFIHVGKMLLDLSPRGQNDGGPWVTTIDNDGRVELSVGNAASTGLDDNSVDAVNLSLVIHELPIEATRQVCEEAFRVLKPGGQLYISEMDFDSPAYAAQRENAMLFSLLRSTEPFLDDYADGCEEIRQFLINKFQTVRITAATGRHYALIAMKDGEKVFEDSRFDADGNYTVDDTHLKVWESKS